jgi:hypothetical protein
MSKNPLLFLKPLTKAQNFPEIIEISHEKLHGIETRIKN